MTRFARAKGSKASNEKTPEDGTPWEVMKEQLLQSKKETEEAKKRQEAEEQRIANYENFLKERKVAKRNATWAEFPEAEQDNENNVTRHEEPTKKKKKHKQKNESVFTNTEVNNDRNIENEEDQNKPSEKKVKKLKNKSKDVVSAEYVSPVVSTVAPDCIQKIKKNKKKKNKQHEHNVDHNTVVGGINSKSEITADTISDKSNKIIKKKNTKLVKNKDNVSAITQDNAEAEDKSKNVNNVINKQNKIKALKNKKNKKLVEGKPIRRKEINDRSFQLIINGKEVELVRYDGFPIMKKDAERLEELKNSMTQKGIPKSEVQRTMKLERRRAEKALARLKRDVCYNCRKGGHNLSDCPELKSKIPGADAAEGVCFKCGSTEHRQFECKVQRDKEFRFATCFICKEPGHIARQCPDNPKGLYPNGGCCKLCGDVTHLRKDCPTVLEKKEGNSVKLQTLDNTENIEDIGPQQKTNTTLEATKKPKKIKF